MNTDSLLKDLNNEQRIAVSTKTKNTVILAGAGSGKTKVLVHRIAWLIFKKKISPFSIMAMTFTNKAANELKEKINSLLGTQQDGIWVGSFHSLAHKFLMLHHVDIGLPKGFQVINNEDQIKLINRIIKVKNLNKNNLSIKNVIKYINNNKDNCIRAERVKISKNNNEYDLFKIYKYYQEICDRSGLVDFSELLLRSYELFLNNPKILKKYHNRFSNILIDEFQDINSFQYTWIKILTGKKCNIMIVGDDDQSIYGWRGSDPKNMKKFLQDYNNSKVIKLERNYRSSNNILKSANILISNNLNRLGKNLWTNEKNGELITLCCNNNEFDEAVYIIHSINNWFNNGGHLKQCAILYRSKNQLGVIKETLSKFSIPYKTYNNINFFEKLEIKNVIFYMRLLVNKNDDIAFEKIINTPARGIGEKTMQAIRFLANSEKITLWKSCNYLLFKNLLLKRSVKRVENFIYLIKFLKKKIKNLPLHNKIYKIIKISGLKNMYENQKNKKNIEYLNNFKKLIKIAKFSNLQKKENKKESLEEFLHKISLNFNSDCDSDKDFVNLMTIHASKGLEFPLVFIIGMEDGIFPNKINIKKNKNLFEERRLAYVALTRAMKKVIITFAENRNLYGKIEQNPPSRFINELPKECVEVIKYVQN